MNEMRFWLLLLPYFLLVGALVVLLLLQAHQNAKIHLGLINKILVKEGLEPLPEIHPLDDLIGNEPDADMTEKVNRAVEQLRRQRAKNVPVVRMNIPGMPRSGMGEVKR